MPTDESSLAKYWVGLPLRARSIGFDSPDLKKTENDLAPASRLLAALTWGVVSVSLAKEKTVAELRRFVTEVSQNPKNEIFEQAARLHPLAASSNAPGAVIFATGEVPSPEIFQEIKALLLANTNQHFTVVILKGVVSAGEMFQLHIKIEEILGEVASRFQIMELKKPEGLYSLPQRILHSMQKRGSIPAGTKVEKFRESRLVVWIDKSAARVELWRDVETTSLLGAVMMHSDLSGNLNDIAGRLSSGENTREVAIGALTLGLGYAMEISRQEIKPEEIRQQTADALAWGENGIIYRFTFNLIASMQRLMQGLKLISSAAERRFLG